MRSKKGVIWSQLLSIIIIAVVIVIILLIFPKQISNFIKGINSCEAKGGVCLSYCPSEDRMLAGDAGCEREFKNQNMVCCEREERAGVEERGYGAHSDLIRLTLNGVSTPLYYGERKDLEIGKTYYLEVFMDDEIRTNPNIKYCGIWMEDKDILEEYVLEALGGAGVSDYNAQRDAPLKAVDRNVANKPNSIIHMCSKRGTTDKLILYPRVFTPTELNAGRTYTFRVIVYSSNVTQALGSGGVSSVEVRDALSNPDNWVAEFTALFRVKPIVEISGISGTWVASDDIIVRANEPYKLSKVEVAIVPGQRNAIIGSEQKSLSQQIQEACNSLRSDIYKSSIHKITALKAGTEGIHLVFTSIGRKNYQKQMYESQAQPIEITENQAKIHLDASSISETFQIDDMLEEEDKPLKEQYLCVKAQVTASGGVPRTRTTYSQQPLRLDVAPPLIDNTDDYMSVVYPDARILENNLQQLLNQGRISPGQQVTPFYFDEYPKVIIKKCFDKSGCKNYDYYFAPTYIRVNINAADLETGLVSMILGQGLNYLYNYLVTRNPLKTICPLANSGQYRHNTHPEIRARRGEQGVFCIKVSDAVGNYWLTWKTVYNPYDVVEDVVQETVT